MNKLFSAIRLFGHIKSSFDIFIEKTLPNIQKRFASSRKKDKHFCGVSSNFFPWKRSFGDLDCSFNRFSDKFWGEKPKKSQIMFFVFKNKQYFSSSFSLGHARCSFEILLALSWKRGRKIWLKIRYWWKISFPQNLSVDT